MRYMLSRLREIAYHYYYHYGHYHYYLLRAQVKSDTAGKFNRLAFVQRRTAAEPCCGMMSASPSSLSSQKSLVTAKYAG